MVRGLEVLEKSPIIEVMTVVGVYLDDEVVNVDEET